jgi:hypothetical protein
VRRGARLFSLSDARPSRCGAPEGKRNGNYKHGGRTKEAIAEVREVNELLRQIRKLR